MKVKFTRISRNPKKEIFVASLKHKWAAWEGLGATKKDALEDLMKDVSKDFQEAKKQLSLMSDVKAAVVDAVGELAYPTVTYRRVK